MTSASSTNAGNSETQAAASTSAFPGGRPFVDKGLNNTGQIIGMVGMQDVMPFGKPATCMVATS